MKKFLLYVLVVAGLAGCKSGDNGQLIGVKDRGQWFDFDPYGMAYIGMGSYQMGPSDQDVFYGLTTQAKTVSVQAFYIDDQEISNNEYRQFVMWVRDSIARRKVVEGGNEELLYPENEDDPDYRQLNWEEKLNWADPNNKEALNDMYLPLGERFYHRKDIDARKLMFEYWWVDLREAAKRVNRPQGLTDRSVFIKKDIINVYPDTLAWIHDFTYAFNEPMTNMYFWHIAYDDYPVVGVTWKQAKAFCIWRTQLLNNFFAMTGNTYVQDFRLPTESEWEYASRGGLAMSPYPWGGPYIRNSEGCFLGNFKPMRGNYVVDGGFHTVKTNSYNPNEYGLYCMAGNVAEWTNNAYDESAYNFAHDLNMDYQYDAKDNDPPALKRKVLRGGSWKDISWYLQTGTRTYEYQDTAKCYIGFRCVMSYLGRAKGDDL